VPLELEHVGAAALAERAPAEAPALRGAELVHLAEELYVRLFAVACAMLVAGGAIALCFATLDRGAPGPRTLAFVAVAAAAAAVGLARPRDAYLALRSRAALQLAPAALASLAVLIDGPESECWWFALPALWVVATVSSTPLAMAGAMATAAAFVAGTALAGQPLTTPGDLGALPATFALPAYTLVARVLVDGFAGLVLGRRRLELERRPVPLRVGVFRVPREAAMPAIAAPVRRRPRPTSKLTARQLEVALLLRDGLRQTEIAECLGISSRQVERLIAGARERAQAATTAQLVAMLATGALGPRAAVSAA